MEKIKTYGDLLEKIKNEEKFLLYIKSEGCSVCEADFPKVKEIKNDFPNFFSAETIYSMFKTAVEQEIAWTEHIIGNRVLGITSQTTEAYTKWLANERLKSLGLEPLFSGFNKNPYKHLERFADTEGEGNVKSNFFEGTVTSYNMSSSIDGWEDF